MDIQELSDVSSSLAIMGDPALQQFAQSHKSDPYMVSLALNESNRRKAVRNAKQAQGGAPQGKVVDQSIAGMSPTPVMTGAGVPLQTGYGGHVQTELPENQGIGRLPAPNMRHMADGGIAGYPDDVEFMSGGGVPGYAAGVLTGNPNATFITWLEGMGITKEAFMKATPQERAELKNMFSSAETAPAAAAEATIASKAAPAAAEAATANRMYAPFKAAGSFATKAVKTAGLPGLAASTVGNFGDYKFKTPENIDTSISGTSTFILTWDWWRSLKCQILTLARILECTWLVCHRL